MIEDAVVLGLDFFSRDAQIVANDLLGKVIYHLYENIWLSAQIIETESYYISEKGSHSSLGFTEKRKALFMEPGTIYMYYARGGDSLNVSVKGEGNAVLIKSGYPYVDKETDSKMIDLMKNLNPKRNGEFRDIDKLCSGQTLICKSLGLKVKEWDARNFDLNMFFIADKGYKPSEILKTKRLGIPKGRDEDLELRFIDKDFLRFTTQRR